MLGQMSDNGMSVTLEEFLDWSMAVRAVAMPP